MNSVKMEIHEGEAQEGKKGKKKEGRVEEEKKAADGKEQIIWQSSASSTQDMLDLLGTKNSHFIIVLVVVIHYWLRRVRGKTEISVLKVFKISSLSHSIKK